jgi:CheY-like chemotaxis protein
MNPNPKRILLVDDDDMLRSVLAQVLHRAGYFINTASDGRQGLEIALAEDYDLVITDLIMPETEGIELIQQLRKVKPAIRIIAMSGGGRVSPENYLSLAKALGATAVLSKPFLNEDILKAVHDALREGGPVT